MGKTYKIRSTKADWAEDVRNCIKELSSDFDNKSFSSLSKLDKGDLMALVDVLEDAVRAKKAGIDPRYRRDLMEVIK